MGVSGISVGLQSPGDDCLLEFAGEAALTAQEQVLSQLLSDGGAAAPCSLSQVLQHRFFQLMGLKARVTKETSVFGRYDRIDQVS